MRIENSRAVSRDAVAERVAARNALRYGVAANGRNYARARSMYSPVRVSTLIISPMSTNAGR